LPQTPPPETVAAVDLGSNSFHMIVCNLKDGKLQTVDRLREMVRLASGLDKKNHLDDKTQKRALECLQRFGQRIRDFPPGSVRIVGTNTLRIAKNAGEFLKKAEAALGHPIHVIAGIEEARLIYQGVAHSLESSAGRRLVMDIGGGSTEYIIGAGDEPHRKESLRMGCVSISNAYFNGGALSKQRFRKAVLFAEQRLEPIQSHFHREHWDEAIGASGTLRAAEAVMRDSGWSKNGITLEGLEKLSQYLCAHTHAKQIDLPGLDPERLPVFPGGVAILYATFKSLGIEQMTVSDGALREGLIYDLVGRIYNRDIRSETVQALAERYHVDRRHALRIKNTLHFMLAQLNDPQLSNDNIVQFLDWAADLHEIGQDIAHSQYHKHSAYIVENADLAGFSWQDQRVLSSIVRNHRRKLSLKRFKELPPPWQHNALYLSVLLRLAVVLHRNRQEMEHRDFNISLAGQRIRLQFSDNALLNSPLTQADLQQEADYLRAANFTLEFS
jgi:exopolyphosphatase/guanosine-5'-triphosphate,3'-diphosphate pyrophosphatase